MRIWVSTLRVRVELPAGFGERRAHALSFFHGHQMALLGGRRFARGAVVLVSHSHDGDLQAGIMTALGFTVLRGSSSRGGAKALSALVRGLRRGGSIALAVDGPRGPRHVAKAGAAAAASAARVPLHPVASFARRAVTLSRAWDGFEIPLPFSRVAVVVGAEVSASSARARPALLSSAIHACRRRAEGLLSSEQSREIQQEERREKGSDVRASCSRSLPPRKSSDLLSSCKSLDRSSVEARR